MIKAFAVTLAVCSLLLFSSLTYAKTCEEATSHTQALMTDLTDTWDELEEGDSLAPIARRIDSVKKSLISVRVYCNDNSDAIIWANKVDDQMDGLIEVLSGDD